MTLLLTTMFFIACNNGNSLDDDDKNKEKPMSCKEACVAFDKDPRNAPKFIKFHYDHAGNKAKEACWEQEVINGLNPAAKCGKEAIDKCAESCKIMREDEKKSK